MIDLVASTVDGGLEDELVRDTKRAAFIAILEEEYRAGRCQQDLLRELRREVEERLG